MPIFYKIEPKVKDSKTYVPSSTLSLLEALTTKMPTSRPYVAPIMIPGTNCPDGTAVPYVTSASKKNVTRKVIRVYELYSRGVFVLNKFRIASSCVLKKMVARSL
jgi:hypothetical protein